MATKNFTPTTSFEKFTTYAVKYGREDLLERTDDFIVPVKLKNGRYVVFAHSTENEFYDCVIYSNPENLKNIRAYVNEIAHILVKDGRVTDLYNLLQWTMGEGEFPIDFGYLYGTEIDIYLEWYRCVDDEVWVQAQDDFGTTSKYNEYKAKDYDEALKIYREKVDEKRAELLKKVEDGDNGNIKLKSTEDNSWTLFELYDYTKKTFTQTCDIRINWTDGQPF